ncbi:MAG TPA: polyprenyl synthetase family protein [Gemmatimonadaceae bacterium]|nr:polyprenyl synthetase family protein [Gemmatimonadaceae bacterium]
METDSLVSAPLAGRAEVEEAIARICRERADEIPDPVRSAVNYALTGGGKRLRGLLVIAAYRAAGGDGDASGLAAAVEIIHAYSLVHDDLPCMDDDDMRRGCPSTHRVFGVPVATAAGAVMIPLAASAAHRAACGLRLPGDACCTIVKVLMQGAGAGGMIGGQLLDLEGEGRDLSRDELDAVHAAKTGALIASSVEIGGVAAQISRTGFNALGSYGSRIGLAFQIMDDVLDVTSSTDKLGKIAGRDAALNKSTYPALLGVEGAVERANQLIDEACRDLHAESLLSPELEGLARFIVSRSH